MATKISRNLLFSIRAKTKPRKVSIHFKAFAVSMGFQVAEKTSNCLELFRSIWWQKTSVKLWFWQQYPYFCLVVGLALSLEVSTISAFLEKFVVWAHNRSFSILPSVLILTKPCRSELDTYACSLIRDDREKPTSVGINTSLPQFVQEGGGNFKLLN